MVHTALEAAEELSKYGISVEVVDPRSLSPLDEETILGSVKKTHRLVAVDEDNPRCGMAADVIALVAQKAFDYLDAPIGRVAALDAPIPFEPRLEEFVLPNPDKIAKAIKQTLGVAV